MSSIGQSGPVGVISKPVVVLTTVTVAVRRGVAVDVVIPVVVVSTVVVVFVFESKNARVVVVVRSGESAGVISGDVVVVTTLLVAARGGAVVDVDVPSEVSPVVLVVVFESINVDVVLVVDRSREAGEAAAVFVVGSDDGVEIDSDIIETSAVSTRPQKISSSVNAVSKVVSLVACRPKHSTRISRAASSCKTFVIVLVLCM
jgi:hypothetical protein